MFFNHLKCTHECSYALLIFQRSAVPSSDQIMQQLRHASFSPDVSGHINMFLCLSDWLHMQKDYTRDLFNSQVNFH